MKYTFHYKTIVFCCIMLAYAATESILEHMPVLASVFIAFFFTLFMAVVAAPDNEKYSKEYNKKRKGL